MSRRVPSPPCMNTDPLALLGLSQRTGLYVHCCKCNKQVQSLEMEIQHQFRTLMYLAKCHGEQQAFTLSEVEIVAAEDKPGERWIARVFREQDYGEVKLPPQVFKGRLNDTTPHTQIAKPKRRAYDLSQ